MTKKRPQSRDRHREAVGSGRDALARQGPVAPLCSTGRNAKSGQSGPAPWTAGKLPSQSYIKAPLSRLSALPIWISIKPSGLRCLRSPFSHETAPPSRLSNRDLGFLTWWGSVSISNLAGTWFGIVCDGRCWLPFFPRAESVPPRPEDDTEKNRGKFDFLSITIRRKKNISGT